MSEITRVSVEPAKCYRISRGWYWGNFFVLHGTDTSGDSPRYWVHLSIVSDFGNYGYCWTHCGVDWIDFLSKVSFDYAMNKLSEGKYMIPLGVDAAILKMKNTVIDARRANDITKPDARTIYDELRWMDETSPESFLRDLDRATGGLISTNEMYHGNWTEPSAQAKGFWKHIWPFFIEEINKEKA